jgi:hypothetical protein
MSGNDFCAECGCWHDLQTPGCDACKHRVYYEDRKVDRPAQYRAMLDRKAAWKRQARAEGRIDRLGRRIHAA